MATHPIHGAWTLVSFDLHLSSDPTSPPILQPLGPDPLGSILFSPVGYMSCTLTSREAAAPMQSAAWSQATDDEVLQAARRLTTYCGQYELYEDAGEQRLSTNVDIALDPNWIGKPQVRKWEIAQQDGRTVGDCPAGWSDSARFATCAGVSSSCESPRDWNREMPADLISRTVRKRWEGLCGSGTGVGIVAGSE